MEFTKIVGKIDPALVKKAEEILTAVFLELGTKYSNTHVGTQMGGDPLIFTLMYPVEHICTLNMPTAATDGKRFYWNPKFVIKQSRLGLRIICGHEAWHALYMHPIRRGSRLPKLWNIAVDYIVNGMVMDDFKARNMDPEKMFSQHLGKYMTLPQYANMLKNPFAPPAGFEDVSKPETASNVPLPGPDEERDLTPEEIEELEKREKKEHFYFADPSLDEEMKSPEKIYDFLYALLPKCPKCGSIGLYQFPQKGKKGKKDSKENSSDGKDKSKKDKKGNKKDQENQGKDKSDSHDHGDGNPCDCPESGDQDGENGQDGNQPNQGGGCCDSEGRSCDGCGKGFDIFGLGGTVDDHLDTSESEEKLAKRISDAIETTKRMAGHVPAALEIELGKLTAPRITWQDVIRSRLVKSRSGNSRNDYTRFKTRPMFCGILTPKKRSFFAKFGCLMDTSGSMSAQDKAFGVSQLQALDEKSEGTMVYGDCEIYWDQAQSLKKCSSEELAKLKPVGGGGTRLGGFFTEYEKHIGKCDFLICITDAYLCDIDYAEMRDPGIPVYWLVTSEASFKAPFGKVFQLQGM